MHHPVIEGIATMGVDFRRDILPKLQGVPVRARSPKPWAGRSRTVRRSGAGTPCRISGIGLR
jgi:hypothetical protein